MISKLLTFSFLVVTSLSFGQAWEQRADSPFLKDHGIGFSLNGFGYVLTGGEDNDVFSSSKDFFKYDPSTDSWSELTEYPGPARGYSIGDVDDGKLYFGFGLTSFGTLLNDIWEWDPVTDNFTQITTCPCSGRVHPAFVAANGKIYVGAGGGPGSGVWGLSDWWVYDIAADSWQQRTNIPEDRHHPYQFEINGDVYVGSGHRDSWYRFNESANSWTQIASLGGGRVAGAQFSYNGKGYALSGTDIEHRRFSTGEFWEYDPLVNTWTSLPPHPGFSRFAPTQFVIDNYIYIAGGYNRSDPNIMIAQNSTWRYQLGPSTASVDEAEEAVTTMVYPNPATDEINIVVSKQLSQQAITNVYNLSGQLIMSLPFEQQLDISQLTTGMYMMDVVDEGVSIVKEKITKL